MTARGTGWRALAGVLALALGTALAARAGEPAQAPVPLRVFEILNRDWTFQLGDHPGAEAEKFDDTTWQPVGLPHTFSLPYFAAGHEFYTGFGWYRKHFEVPAGWAGRRIQLDFEGAFQDAEIFVNGRKVGAHRGGYTGFAVDVTEAARTGSNLLAVRLNNLWNPRLAPRAGEHVFSGGLYRNVRLVALAPLHVAWYGTSVTTPQVSAAAGTVNVKTEVANQSGATKACTVHTAVVDPAGRVVTETSSTQPVPPGATVIFDQTTAPVSHPELWSPEQPRLYAVRTTVLDDGHPVDDYESPLGFRWIEFTADRGFFLNGEHHYFKGANVHQDHAGWGDGVTDRGFRRDLQLMKEAGMDFIRGSHYPHAPAFSAACDSLGLLFWSENCFWGTAGFKSPWAASAYPTDPDDVPEFEASVKASLRDMIRIHRNHPSIVVWSTGNEVFFSDRKVLPQVRRFLTELVAEAHTLDPTRPVAIGGSQRGDIDKLGDIAGYNGDGARLFPHPGIPSVVSEYGSTMTDRPGRYEPGWGDLPATAGADPAVPDSWRQPWRSGEAIWCGFDHGSVAGRQFGAMGLVDYFRLPKRQWYWYRNEYRQIAPPPWPVAGTPAALTLTADRATLATDGTDDAQVVVTVVDRNGQPLSECPPVTLAIVSGPGELPTGRDITFAADTDIPIRDGTAAIEFRSYQSGETVIRATSPGLKDATIRLNSHGGPAFAAGVTPPVPARPYVRFTRPPEPGASGNFGGENPTRASSEAAGHSARMANDGFPATGWEAVPGDSAPWWRVDLERIVQVRRARLTFPAPGDWVYRIEISIDGERDWQVLATASAGASKAERIDGVAEGTPAGRFVRVTLTHWPANVAPGIAEFYVTGSIVTR